MLEELLIEDVKTLPILTGRSQELWLGIQVKAPQRYKELLKADERGNKASLLAIYSSLYAQALRLEEACEKHGVSPPNISRWIVEIFTTRRNVCDLRRSRLRRFVRRLNRFEKDPDAGQALIEVTYEIAELLTVLPNKPLRYLGKFEKLPLPEVFEEWIIERAFKTNSLYSAVLRQAERAKRTLTTGYLRYALRMARQYVDQGVDYLDLVQAAFLGLMRAVDKFDYQEQARFATYASTWIWQRINRTIENQCRLIRIPVHVQSQIQKIEEVYEQLWEEQGREPTFDELLFRLTFLEEEEIERIERCRANGYSLPSHLALRYKQAANKLRDRIFMRQNILSLDDVPESACKPLVDRCTYHAQDPLTSISRGHLMRKVNQLLEDFSERDQRILKTRFGLDTGEVRTLAEVGEEFGLTRERVRQIETRIIEHLARSIPEQQLVDCLMVQPQCTSPNHDTPSVGRSLFPTRKRNGTDWTWLDRLLEELPGGDWHRSQDRQGATREEQLVEALGILQEPAHYSEIAEQVNDMLEQDELGEKYIYSLLFSNEDSFILLGEGVFSLAAWERERSKKATPVLPFCPAPLPHTLERDQVFLESILIAEDMLKQELTAEEFLNEILAWAGVAESQSTWLLQNVLSAYYLVGVVPYHFYPDEAKEILISTLPEMELQELRRYCLRSMTQRLVAMPQFWWLVQRYEPGRACDIAGHFVDVHPVGLDDTLNRLELLTSIGAAQKSRYARFRLTSLGKELAYELGKAPDTLEEKLDSSPPSTDVDLDAFDLIAF